MKLVPKLTLALLAGMCAVVGVNAYFRVRRELAYVAADRVRDHEMVARAIGAAAGATWQSEGRTASVRVVEAATTHFAQFDIRWVDTPNVPGACGDLWPAAGAFLAAAAEQPRTKEDAGRVHTCMPVDVRGERRGAVELVQSKDEGSGPVRSAVSDAAATALAIACISALLAWWLGSWLVGGPVTLLAEQARRIGRGDFARPLRLQRSDEFTELASEMNAMASRLVATLEQLRHADRLATVGKLASGIAHELGTPLNVISMRAAMLAAGEANAEEAREYAGVIAGAAERMTHIIRQLLAFARKRGANKARTDVRRLVEEAVHLLRPLAEKKNVRVEVGSEEVDATAEVDSAQLEQVVTNLVMNALQATPPDGTIRVEVSRARGAPPEPVDAPPQPCVRVRVKDAGAGIGEDVLPHIFEPFFTTKDVGSGTGLGLSVSYGIVQDHGGWIRVESRVDHGSTFDVYLPVDAGQP